MPRDVPIAERDLVAPQHEAAPVPGFVEADQQAEHGHHTKPQRAQVRRQQHAQPLCVGPRRQQQAVRGGDPLGYPEVAADDRRSTQAGQQTQASLGTEYAPEHLGLADLTKPEQIKVEPRQAAPRPDEDNEDPGGYQDHQRPPGGWTASCSHVDLFIAGQFTASQRLSVAGGGNDPAATLAPPLEHGLSAL